MFTRMYLKEGEGGYHDAVLCEEGALEKLYEALSKTNQEPVVREFLEAIRPGV